MYFGVELALGYLVVLYQSFLSLMELEIEVC